MRARPVCIFCRKPIPEGQVNCELCYRTFDQGRIPENLDQLEFFSHRESNRRISVDEAFHFIENWPYEPDNYLAFIRMDGLCAQLCKAPGGEYELQFPGQPGLGVVRGCSVRRASQFFSLFASFKKWNWLFNKFDKKESPSRGEGDLALIEPLTFRDGDKKGP